MTEIIKKKQKPYWKTNFKNWETLEINRKVILLHIVLHDKRVGYWHFTSKETQRRFDDIIHDRAYNDRIDFIRQDILDTYIKGNSTNTPTEKDIRKIKVRLLMGDNK